MSENTGEKKEKVSIADALEQLRQGKAANDNKPSATSAAAAAASQQRQQRIPPSFWLTNLQESIQRRRDQLFDKITEDASGQAGMNRRDLVATESFFLPAEMVSEMTPPSQPQGRVSDVSRYQDIDVMGFQGATQEEHEQAPVPVKRPVIHEPTVITTRFEEVQPLDAGFAMEEVGHDGLPVSAPADPLQAAMRFDGIGDLDFGMEGLVIEEVQTEQVETEQKKFRVNPMFRQMFQNLGKENQEEEQGE